jgi:hypothetical protein
MFTLLFFKFLYGFFVGLLAIKVFLWAYHKALRYFARQRRAQPFAGLRDVYEMQMRQNRIWTQPPIVPDGPSSEESLEGTSEDEPRYENYSIFIPDCCLSEPEVERETVSRRQIEAEFFGTQLPSDEELVPMDDTLDRNWSVFDNWDQGLLLEELINSGMSFLGMRNTAYEPPAEIPSDDDDLPELEDDSDEHNLWEEPRFEDYVLEEPISDDFVEDIIVAIGKGISIKALFLAICTIPAWYFLAGIVPFAVVGLWINILLIGGILSHLAFSCIKQLIGYYISCAYAIFLRMWEIAKGRFWFSVRGIRDRINNICPYLTNLYRYYYNRQVRMFRYMLENPSETLAMVNSARISEKKRYRKNKKFSFKAKKLYVFLYPLMSQNGHDYLQYTLLLVSIVGIFFDVETVEEMLNDFVCKSRDKVQYAHLCSTVNRRARDPYDLKAIIKNDAASFIEGFVHLLCYIKYEGVAKARLTLIGDYGQTAAAEQAAEKAESNQTIDSFANQVSKDTGVNPSDVKTIVGDHGGIGFGKTASIAPRNKIEWVSGGVGSSSDVPNKGKSKEGTSEIKSSENVENHKDSTTPEWLRSLKKYDEVNNFYRLAKNRIFEGEEDEFNVYESVLNGLDDEMDIYLEKRHSDALGFYSFTAEDERNFERLHRIYEEISEKVPRYDHSGRPGLVVPQKFRNILYGKIKNDSKLRKRIRQWNDFLKANPAPDRTRAFRRVAEAIDVHIAACRRNNPELDAAMQPNLQPLSSSDQKEEINHGKNSKKRKEKNSEKTRKRDHAVIRSGVSNELVDSSQLRKVNLFKIMYNGKTGNNSCRGVRAKDARTNPMRVGVITNRHLIPDDVWETKSFSVTDFTISYSDDAGEVCWKGDLKHTQIVPYTDKPDCNCNVNTKISGGDMIMIIDDRINVGKAWNVHAPIMGGSAVFVLPGYVSHGTLKKYDDITVCNTLAYVDASTDINHGSSGTPVFQFFQGQPQLIGLNKGVDKKRKDQSLIQLLSPLKASLLQGSTGMGASTTMVERPSQPGQKE